MPKSLAKRLASLLLILAMVMALMPSAAAAESDAVSSNTAGEITTVSEESSTTVLPVEAAVPDIIGIEEAEARGHVKRLRDEEQHFRSAPGGNRCPK